MKRIVVILVLLLVPASVFAATTVSARNLVFSSHVSGVQNVYLAGMSVTVATTSPADLTVIGGSVVASAPVKGDALIAAGSLALRGNVMGDLRAIGGRVIINAPVKGDLVVLATSIYDLKAQAKNILAIGETVHLSSGSRGNVKVYGNDIYLSGHFAGNVYASALNKVVLAPHTVITGTLRYQASEVATIPLSARINGGATYTGASFLPTSQEAEAFALASIGIFFLVRIFGALLVAGLLAGLFPSFTQHLSKEVFENPIRHALLLILLGFGTFVAVPVLIVLLSITFIGLSIAFVLGAAYLLLLSLAFAYAGILVGALWIRTLMKRTTITWRDAVLGMLALMIFSILPIIGMLVIMLLIFLAMGAIVHVFYKATLKKQDTEFLTY